MNKIHALPFANRSRPGLAPLLLSTRKPRMRIRRRSISTMPAADMKWIPMPGLDGAQQFRCGAIRRKGAPQSGKGLRARRLRAALPHERRPRSRRLGHASLALEGAEPKMPPAGLYFAGRWGQARDRRRSQGDTPCVFYIEREGAFDAVMAAPASAPKK